MNPIKVEVGQYREINKGTLKAFFTLVIFPTGQKILDCKYFTHEEKRWFSFPTKEVTFTDGRKSEYIPLISFLDKSYAEELKKAVLTALKEAKPQVNNEQKKDASYSRQKNMVSTQSSSGEEELPF
jgi:hypothetical protein